MLPTKEMWFHSKGEIPKRAINTENFKNRMIEETLKSNYLRSCDGVIIVEHRNKCKK